MATRSEDERFSVWRYAMKKLIAFALLMRPRKVWASRVGVICPHEPPRY